MYQKLHYVEFKSELKLSTGETSRLSNMEVLLCRRVEVQETCRPTELSSPNNSLKRHQEAVEYGTPKIS